MWQSYKPTWRATGWTQLQPAPPERCCSRLCISASLWQSMTALSESKTRKKTALRLQNELNASEWDQIADKLSTRQHRRDDCGKTAGKLFLCLKCHGSMPGLGRLLNRPEKKSYLITVASEFVISDFPLAILWLKRSFLREKLLCITHNYPQTTLFSNGAPCEKR